MTPVARWEKRAEIPLLMLALAFLIAYAWPVLDPRLDADIRTVLEIASWTVWTAFVVDFAVRLYLTDERQRYALAHWYDVALILLPMLRPHRLLRLLAFARILNRSAVGSLVGKVSTYVAGTAAMALGLGAIAVLDAEQDSAGANITTFGDALWWSATTVTTVGYGDHFPVTTSGRFVAVALMLVGIACIGAITAGVGSVVGGAGRSRREPTRAADRSKPVTRRARPGSAKAQQDDRQGVGGCLSGASAYVRLVKLTLLSAWTVIA